ncbi:MAG: hypothetical protein EOO04_18470 [Chitinophagaceae bacterium]|nr:MAG: hypothetical protein EOO04_18470 [Chitinophagaceae bacterium]
MKCFFALLFFFVLCCDPVKAQEPVREATVFTIDLDNFWMAYDSIKSTGDPGMKREVIQSLYIDRGSAGLKAFVRARNYTADVYLRLIEQYPNFWISVRPQTLAVKEQVPLIEKSIRQLQVLYPEMKSAGIYFTIGALRSGGTMFSNMVLIGTELAAADSGTNASELNSWARNQLKSQAPGSIVALNVHEFIHTQQKAPASVLLAQCLHEGAADFIAELVTRQKNLNDYMIYGKNRESELKPRFRSEMMRRSTAGWLFNSDRSEHPDLGYYIGYAICKSYYDNATDKKKAIRDIIELDYNSRMAVSAFLDQSGYYGNPNLRTQ